MMAMHVTFTGLSLHVGYVMVHAGDHHRSVGDGNLSSGCVGCYCHRI